MKLKISVFISVWVTLITQSMAQSNVYGSAKLINQQADGYQGIWYVMPGVSRQAGPINDNYRFKYSGGLGTYTTYHYPFSVYIKAVDKTFFCYGGANDSGTLVHMVSYFDHKTKQVPRPTIVLDKATDDAHDNPVIQVDKDGYIWIFSTSHGTGRPSFIHKSTKPYDISEFKRVPATKIENGEKVPLSNFSYLQIYYSEEEGFTGLFTHYEKSVRVLKWMTSNDGIEWSEWKYLSSIPSGQYQSSGIQGRKIGTAFNYHPNRQVRGGLDFRTNLYYLQSNDFGKTWITADGSTLKIPLTEVANEALVYDYDSEERNVYISDVNFDEKGRPIILYITSRGPRSGPEDGPRMWHTAWWSGKKWVIHPLTPAGNNYDAGSIYIEEGGIWKVIAPTKMGPQPYYTGGEMEMWESENNGKTWKKIKKLTEKSIYNHTYARRPTPVNPEFYAFWADGHGEQPSESRLYFCDSKGNVYQLPQKMTTEFDKPILYQSTK